MADDLVADEGGFALAGQDADLLAALQLVADEGTFAFDGQDADLLVAYPLPADAGVFSLNGQVLEFSMLGHGDFVLAGQDVTLARVALNTGPRGRASRGRGLHTTPPLPLVLPTGSTIGKDGQVANARLVNAYAEDNGQDAKSRYTIYAAPGRTRWDSAAHAGGCRGLIELDRNSLIAVLGNEIATFDASGNSTLLATIVGSTRVQTARNRRTTPQIGIVTDVGQYYVLESGVLTQVGDVDLPAPNSIDYLDGFFLFGIDDGRIFASDLENGLSIQADAFDHAKSDSSRLRRVKANAGYLYVFKEKGAEIWKADPSLAAENFPFAPVQQDIDIGCGAPHSITGFSRGLGWIDDEGIVRFGRDGDAQRISSHTVERAIQDLTPAQLDDVYGFSHTFQGHETYVLRSARWTWAYDVVNQKWYERTNREGGPWAPNAHAIFNGKDIVGNASNGQLHFIDTEAYRDGGDHLIQEIWCAQSHRFPNRMIVDAIEIDAISGVGLNSGDVHNDDPQIMIDYSDNGGKTFHGERLASLGPIGDYRCSIRLNRWGQVNEKGRIWRIRASAAVLRGINQAALTARPIG